MGHHLPRLGCKMGAQMSVRALQARAGLSGNLQGHCRQQELHTMSVGHHLLRLGCKMGPQMSTRPCMHGLASQKICMATAGSRGAWATSVGHHLPRLGHKMGAQMSVRALQARAGLSGDLQGQCRQQRSSSHVCGPPPGEARAQDGRSDGYKTLHPRAGLSAALQGHCGQQELHSTSVGHHLLCEATRSIVHCSPALTGPSHAHSWLQDSQSPEIACLDLSC